MNKIQKLKIAKFVQYVLKQLNISAPFKLQLVSSRDESFKTYAFYDPQSGLVKVYINNRGLADILRSIAHEFVHHKQNQDKRLNGPQQDVGGQIEDEANSRAGSLVKQFGYENPRFSIYNS